MQIKQTFYTDKKKEHLLLNGQNLYFESLWFEIISPNKYEQKKDFLIFFFAQK